MRVTLVLIGVVVSCAVGATFAVKPASGIAAGQKTVVVPSVIGLRMDLATHKLHSVGLRVNEECSGLFGCIIKRNWVICTQSPHAGKRVRAFSVVHIFGERSRADC